MLTATANQTVIDVLAMFIAQDRVFTAYDVTVEARKKTPERIDHRDVRQLVHDNWITSGFPDNYDRQEGIELKTNGNPLVIVYYPDTKTAYDHPFAMPASAPAPSYSTPAPTTTTTSKLGGSVKIDDDSYTCTPTAEGRINVPKVLIDKVDKTGGSVDFMVSGTLHPRIPNSDGRVRISLQKLDFDATADVTVTVSADRRSITLSA